MTRGWTLAYLVAGVIALALGCGDDSASQDGSVVVFAAASLTDAFSEMIEEFESGHPGTTIDLNVGGSSSLREQILAGAPADIFASANEATMAEVVEGGEAKTDPVVFATNSMTIAVPPGNPAGVTGLESFADEELLIGLCARGVPCGDLARSILSAAGINPSLDTEELDVRALLFKVAEGELDAGLVYTSDISATRSPAEAIALDDEFVSSGSGDFLNRYLIAQLQGGNGAEGTGQFLSYVTSTEGQAILARHGFGAP